MPEPKTSPSKARAAHPLPTITEAEWIVMKALWDHEALTTNQVVDALKGQTDWKPKTIHTLLGRLSRKGALRFEKQGREYLFRPTVTAEACEHAATRSFLDRFFDGQLAPFLARFVEREQLKPEDIQRLKDILERKLK